MGKRKNKVANDKVEQPVAAQTKQKIVDQVHQTHLIEAIKYLGRAIQKAQAKQKKHDYLFWRWSRFRAVRMGQWKGVQTNKDLALYDLNEDIGEESDVAKQHPKIAARIKEIIDELE